MKLGTHIKSRRLTAWRARGTGGTGPTRIIRKREKRTGGEKKKKNSKAATTEGERVHVDIQFSSDQKVKGTAGPPSLTVVAVPSRILVPPAGRPFAVGPGPVENKVSRRRCTAAEEIYGAISRPAWHSTIRINTFFSSTPSRARSPYNPPQFPRIILHVL